jgi:2-methylcitrate dehydratase PrpD
LPDSETSASEIFEELKTLRDRLAVQVHLGKAEAREEWEKLEKQFEDLQKKAEPFTEAAGETARGLGAAAHLAVEELLEGYRKLRKLL